jgi:hypothetical protein
MEVYSVCEHGTHTHSRTCDECSYSTLVEGYGGTLIERRRPYLRGLVMIRPGVWTLA